MTADYELDPLVRRAAEALRRPVTPGPGFDTRVLAAVRAEGRRGPLDWLLRPRLVRVAPVVAFAGIAAVAAIAAIGTGTILWTGVPARAPSAVNGAASTALPVRFVIAAPGARTVALVGTFNDWDPAAMPLRAEAAGGVWTIEVPLEAGRHEYAFVVDGDRWVADPRAPAAIGDFGEPNSVVTVAGRS